jgi:serine/threonine protein phosphatase 1
MKRFVIGDIHGAHKALLQCMKRAGFDSDSDFLISLGDICDGWPDTNKVVEELLRIKNFTLILGNHDEWSMRWMKKGWKGYEWVSQGGQATLESYNHRRENVPQSHIDLMQSAKLYVELDDKLFVHGGIDPSRPLDKQDAELLMWDRNLLYDAVRFNEKNCNYRFGKWSDIFIGHTTTQSYRMLEPLHACNVWNLDTGGGWSGKLTIMDMDTYEYWQSDLVPELYPNIVGR